MFAWSVKLCCSVPGPVLAATAASVRVLSFVPALLLSTVVAGHGDQGSGCALRSCSHIAGETGASSSPFEVVALCHAADRKSAGV